MRHWACGLRQRTRARLGAVQVQRGQCPPEPRAHPAQAADLPEMLTTEFAGCIDSITGLAGHHGVQLGALTAHARRRPLVTASNPIIHCQDEVDAADVQNSTFRVAAASSSSASAEFSSAFCSPWSPESCPACASNRCLAAVSSGECWDCFAAVLVCWAGARLAVCRASARGDRATNRGLANGLTAGGKRQCAAGCTALELSRVELAGGRREASTRGNAAVSTITSRIAPAGRCDQCWLCPAHNATQLTALC